MSLFGALFAGVSALGAQSQSMGTISNNIANVNTIGYKRDVTSFSSLVTTRGRGTAYAPGGVRPNTIATVNQQGIIQPSSSSTDVAISGDGFFVVQPTTANMVEKFYTRSGRFAEDQRGFLRNDAGYFLMGWRLQNDGSLPPGNGDVTSLEPVDVAFLNGVTAPTTEAEVSLNLDAGQDTGVAGVHFSRTMTVYDSLGAAQYLELNFSKVADDPSGTASPNTWTVTIDSPGSATFNGTAGPTSFGPIYLKYTSSGTLDVAATDTLNDQGTHPTVPAEIDTAVSVGTDGRLRIDIPDIDWKNASALQDIMLDLNDTSQFAADYSVAYMNQDGAELGLRTGVSIDKDGYVVASFSNGQTRNLYKLPLATFTNPNGLEARTGNVWVQTNESGDYNLREAGTAGAGIISPSSLEASNVDLADEFSRMIVTQRAYSAGTKVISTADQMMQELMQIR